MGIMAFFKRSLITFVMIAGTLIMAQSSIAGGDLDDDISNYKDDTIAGWDELGKATVNINYVICEALDRVGKPDTDSLIQNSVVVGAGSTVGDIYNIHLNEASSSSPQRDKDDEKTEN